MSAPPILPGGGDEGRSEKESEKMEKKRKKRDLLPERTRADSRRGSERRLTVPRLRDGDGDAGVGTGERGARARSSRRWCRRGDVTPRERTRSAPNSNESVRRARRWRWRDAIDSLPERDALLQRLAVFPLALARSRTRSFLVCRRPRGTSSRLTSRSRRARVALASRRCECRGFRHIYLSSTPPGTIYAPTLVVPRDYRH